MSKNNNIPPYLLCSTPDLARQVLEKIERESDLKKHGVIKPSEITGLNEIMPVVICTKNNIWGESIANLNKKGITNFTKAEDFLYLPAIEELTNKINSITLEETNNNSMTNKTWETLSEGDILISDSGEEKKVLATLGSLIFPTYQEDFSKADTPYLKEELIKMGYKIKGASEEKPSIQDIIEKLVFAYPPLTPEKGYKIVGEVIEMLKKLK